MNLLLETLNGANINEFATTIKSAHIIKINYIFDNEHLVLNEAHTIEEAISFLNKLDFNYDNGYGLQYIDGRIHLKDGTIMKREEYDGAEGWIISKS